MKKAVSIEFRDFCLNKYPALRDNESYREMFRYLCFATFFDEDTGLQCIPRQELMRICNTRKGTFSGKAFLEAFIRDVLPDLALTNYRSFNFHGWDRKCRQVANNGFDADMYDAFKKEVISEDVGEVFFVSGYAYTNDRIADVRKAKRLEHIQLAETFVLNPTQRKIYDYLDAIEGDRFVRKLNQNIDDVNAVISTLHDASAYVQNRIVHSIREYSKIHYCPSRNGRTSRLHNCNDSPIGFKKIVRRAYSKGWSEVDLRCSQFAILATILDARLAQDFLATGNSLWTYLHAASGNQLPMTAEHKAIYKELIYSICFGKSKKELVKYVKAKNIRGLANDPILSELLALRSAWFNEIGRKGYVLDAWNNRLHVSHSRWIGAVAAAAIQSIELEIVSAIFDVAIEHGDCDHFSICMFQHDGATISFQSKAGQTRAFVKMRDAVNSRAAQFNVNTTLEIEEL